MLWISDKKRMQGRFTKHLLSDAKVVDLLPKKAKIKHPLPFPCYVPEGIGMTEVYNPISKRSVQLNAEALVVYEVTIGLNRILFGGCP